MQIELKRIQREVGITFIFVTHDQEEALTMSDRIAVMSAGRVEQVGSPEEIYDSPATAFVAGLHRHGEPAAGDGGSAIARRRAVVRLAADRPAEVPIAGQTFAAGERRRLMIRPERIRVTRRRAGRRRSVAAGHRRRDDLPGTRSSASSSRTPRAPRSSPT